MQDEVTVKGMCPRYTCVNVCVGVIWEVRVPTTLQCVLTDEVPSLSNTGKLSSGTELVNVDCRQMPCGGTWDVGKCEKGLGVSAADV